MPNVLSYNLRKRIIRLWLHEGLKPDDVAQALRVNRKTVLKYIHLFEDTGDVSLDSIASLAAWSRSHQPKHIVDATWRLLEEDCTLYLDEIADRLNVDPLCAGLTILGEWRLLKSMGVTQQKVNNHV
jgi:hypothetical protein